MIEKTSIVIPVYNHLYYTRQILGFIRRFTNVPHEIIVIDDHSRDGTPQFLKAISNKRYENLVDFRVITNKKRMGVTYCWNVGMEAAYAKHVAVINNDIILPPRWAEIILSVFRRDKNIKCVTPIELPRLTIEEYWEKAEDLAKDYLMWEMITRPPALPGGFTGACFVLRKDAWEKLEGFDIRYNLWFGDIDLFLRMQKIGWSTVQCLNVLMYHFCSKSVNALPKYLDLFEKDKKLFYEQWPYCDSYRQYEGLI